MTYDISASLHLANDCRYKYASTLHLYSGPRTAWSVWTSLNLWNRLNRKIHFVLIAAVARLLFFKNKLFKIPTYQSANIYIQQCTEKWDFLLLLRESKLKRGTLLCCLGDLNGKVELLLLIEFKLKTVTVEGIQTEQACDNNNDNNKN